MLIHIRKHYWCWDKPRATLDSLDSPRPRLRGSHHLPPYSILCVTLPHPCSNGFLSGDSQGGVPKLSRIRLLGLCNVRILCLDLRLEWGLKQTCSIPWELSNGVSHSICKHRGWVDSRLLVIGSQTANLTSDPSFDHNLCCRCWNGSCKAIFDIYISKTFQWCKEHLKARCFDLYNRTLKFWESQRTLSSHFWECEFHPHTCLKMGLRQLQWNVQINDSIQKIVNHKILFGLKFIEYGGNQMRTNLTFLQ
jgi:hypothetical protein